MLLQWMLLVVLASACAEDWKGFSVSCLSETNATSCHGVRLVRKIVQTLLEEARRKKNLEIVDGISLVQSESAEDARSGDKEVGTIVGFLENRELRIRLGNLMPDNWEAAVQESLPTGE